jgi:hypothetical protein
MENITNIGLLDRAVEWLCNNIHAFAGGAKRMALFRFWQARVRREFDTEPS